MYMYLNHSPGDMQYVGEHLPENQIFAQCHKDYTSEM